MRKSKNYSLFILSAFFMLAVGCNFKSDKEKFLEMENRFKTEKPIVASVFQVYKDYSANEVAADNKYKEKIIELNGTVVNISEHSVIALKVTLEDKLGLRVDCLFVPLLHRDELSNIQKGNEIKVRGRFFGIKDGNLRMAGCWLHP